MDELIKNFNDIALQMLGELKKIMPHSILLQNADLLKAFTQNESNKTVIIDGFVVHVLKYKDQIDSNDENFFLAHDFNDEVQNSKNSSIVKIINEVKSMWKELSDENKQSIFGYLQVLCFYSQEYFIELDSQKN